MAKKEMIKSFVLRVDAETMEAIEKWAADEFRSTNGQLMDYSGSFAQEWQNEEKEDNNQKRRNRMIQLF